MNTTKPPRAKKKYYSIAEANAMLPLLRCILRDITNLAHDLRRRHERLVKLQDGAKPEAGEDVQQMIDEFESLQDKMHEFEDELRKLDVELKDYFTGLIDFRHLRDGKEVYLCWRLGEDEVAHWHELHTGFGGRKKLEEARS
jgi:hypothetical protein